MRRYHIIYLKDDMASELSVMGSVREHPNNHINVAGAQESGNPVAWISSLSRDDDAHFKRSGNVWTAAAHVITAVIGSGVLSLAWSMAQLGWVAGPIFLAAFSVVTLYTSILLADCYRSPDPVTGKRNYTYMDAVRANLRGIEVFLCGLLQYTNLVGTSIGYTITASISMVAVRRAHCFHRNGRNSPCHVSNNPYMIIFGILQLVFSQMPDFNRIAWLSIVAAVMSFTYSSIGLGLSIAKTTQKNRSHGTVRGVGMKGLFSNFGQTWDVFQALGNIAFAYSFSMILIEIQDTVKTPPPENKTMKRASIIGVAVTTLYYISVGCVGYAAFGNDAPGNLLTGFGFFDPYWLVEIANIAIAVHLVGAYQVFSQPVFAFVEEKCASTWPKSCFIHNEYKITDIPYLERPLSFNFFRIVWRSCFVVFTTVVAMLFPFFNDVVGILGALAFFPLTVYFPVQMYMVQLKVPRWSRMWKAHQVLNIVCFIISFVSLVGSVAGVVIDLKHYTPFKTTY